MTGQIKQEIRSLTGLRGVAACLVMLYHFKMDNYLPTPLNSVIHHGYLSVDLFFILSGFVMALTYSHLFKDGFQFDAYKKFLFRRIARVYPLYFVAVTSAILVFYFFPSCNDTNIEITLPKILANIFMVQSWGFSRSYLVPGWSISTELAAYIVFPFLLMGTFFSSRRTSVVCGLLSVMTLVILALIPNDYMDLGKSGKIMNIWNENTFAPLLRCLSEFSLGLLTFRVYRNASLLSKLQNIRVSWVIFAVFVIFFMIPKADVLIILLTPLFILSLTAEKFLPAQILGHGAIYNLGVISYSLYLCHLMTFWIKPFILNMLDGFGDPSHAYLFAGLIQIALSLGLATMTYHFIEKPGRMFLQKVFS